MILRLSLDEKPELFFTESYTHKGHPEKFLQKFWTLHLYSYHAQLNFRGELFDVRPGHMSLVSADTAYNFVFNGPSTHLYAHFFPAAGDMRKAVLLPVMRPLGAFYPRIHEKMTRMIQLFPINRRHAEVILWDILWDLVDMERREAPLTQQALDQAICYIEQHLHEPLRVVSLVDEVSVSHNTLLNLFQEKFGKSIAAYICDRRMQRAHNLLIYTALPIKTIAADCGLPDLNQFNKTIRRTFGAAPRALREKAQSDGSVSSTKA